MGNVVSYFLQKPEQATTTKKEGCCSGNKIEKTDEPVRTIETSTCHNVEETQTEKSRELKVNDTGDDFEVIPEERQQQLSDACLDTEEGIPKVDNGSKIEEANDMIEKVDMVEMIKSDNEQMIETDKTEVQPNISAVINNCEVEVQNSIEVDIIREENIDSGDVNEKEILHNEEVGRKEEVLEEVQHEPKFDDKEKGLLEIGEQLKQNNFDENEDESSNKKIEFLGQESEKLEEIEINTESKSDCVEIVEEIPDKNSSNISDESTQDKSELETSVDVDLLVVDETVKDVETIRYIENDDRHTGQEEENAEILNSEQKSEGIPYQDSEKYEHDGTDTEKREKAVDTAGDNESLKNENEFSNQELEDKTEDCGESYDAESVECRQDGSESTNANVDEDPIIKDNMENKLGSDTTCTQSPDQEFEIETVEPIQKTIDIDHVENLISKDVENFDKSENCVLEESIKDKINEELDYGEDRKSEEECKLTVKPDDNTDEEIVESFQEKSDDLHIDESVSTSNIEQSTEQTNVEVTEENKNEAKHSVNTEQDTDEGKIEKSDDLNKDVSVSEPLPEHADVQDIELIGENENEAKHIDIDPLTHTDEPQEERKKAPDTENEKQDEDIFSKVIDNCKMEIENIHISMVGSLESEEKENKETDEVSNTKDNGETNSCLINENEKSDNDDEIADQNDSSITQKKEKDCHTYECDSEIIESSTDNLQITLEGEESAKDYKEQPTEDGDTQSKNDLSNVEVIGTVTETKEEDIEAEKSTSIETPPLDLENKGSTILSKNNQEEPLEVFSASNESVTTDTECCNGVDAKECNSP